MFNSPILDVAFGLLFVFLAVSLAAGTILETGASITGWRAATLLSGIQKLLNDPTKGGLVLELYQHASISPRDSGQAPDIKKLKNKPAYIDPKQFANAVLDIINVSTVAPGQGCSTLYTTEQRG